MSNLLSVPLLLQGWGEVIKIVTQWMRRKRTVQQNSPKTSIQPDAPKIRLFFLFIYIQRWWRILVNLVNYWSGMRAPSTSTKGKENWVSNKFQKFNRDRQYTSAKFLNDNITQFSNVPLKTHTHKKAQTNLGEKCISDLDNTQQKPFEDCFICPLSWKMLASH